MSTAPIHVGDLRAYHKGDSRWQIQTKGGNYVRSVKSTREGVETWMRQRLAQPEQDAAEAGQALDDAIARVAELLAELRWSRVGSHGLTIVRDVHVPAPFGCGRGVDALGSWDLDTVTCQDCKASTAYRAAAALRSWETNR